MNKIEEPKIYFSREQYEYLNKMFPEIVGTANSTNEELRHNTAQRSVVYFLKTRVRN